METPNLTDVDAAPSTVEHEEDNNTDQKRSELIRLAESGDITHSVKCIRKASDKVVLRYYSEYEQKQADNANTFLADALITKFAELMIALDVVDSDDELTKELRGDVLLQRNVKSALGFITPFIPFIGVISGGAKLGKHVVKHRTRTTGE